LTFDSKERGAFLSSSRSNDDGPSSQLADCVERGLGRYGATMTRVVFWNFEKKFGLQKEDISKYPEKFVLSIEGMFAAGAPNVERTIIQEMKSSITHCDLDDSSLVTALKQARAFFQRNRED
jgi:hypothetical protein